MRARPCPLKSPVNTGAGRCIVFQFSGGVHCFSLIVGMEKGYKAQTSIIEIGQYWWNSEGKQTIVAIQRTMGSYLDTFAFHSPKAIRRDNEVYQYIAQSPLYPKV